MGILPGAGTCEVTCKIRSGGPCFQGNASIPINLTGPKPDLEGAFQAAAKARAGAFLTVFGPVLGQLCKANC